MFMLMNNNRCEISRRARASLAPTAARDLFVRRRCSAHVAPEEEVLEPVGEYAH